MPQGFYSLNYLVIINVVVIAGQAAGPADRQVLTALGDVLVLAEPLLLRLWKTSHLTLVQLRVLRVLRDQSCSPGELASLVGVSAPSMARTLARLEERGLVSRSIDLADRRRVQVAIRPQGRKLLGANRLWKGTAFESAALALKDADRQRLVSSLGTFAALLRRELDPEAEGYARLDHLGAGDRRLDRATATPLAVSRAPKAR